MQVFSSFSGFMLGYHVHEKAIMTAIVPLTLLATSSRLAARLFIRTCMFGIFGLLPLLFRPEELLLKVVLYTTWIFGAVYVLELVFDKGREQSNLSGEGLLTNLDLLTFLVLACVLVFMEIIHPIKFMPSGQLEFLPLMVTSGVCAIGLLHCWIQSFIQMRNCSQKMQSTD